MPVWCALHPTPPLKARLADLAAITTATITTNFRCFCRYVAFMWYPVSSSEPAGTTATMARTTLLSCLFHEACDFIHTPCTAPYLTSATYIHLLCWPSIIVPMNGTYDTHTLSPLCLHHRMHDRLPLQQHPAMQASGKSMATPPTPGARTLQAPVSRARADGATHHWGTVSLHPWALFIVCPG
jgi:hypothetical protein